MGKRLNNRVLVLAPHTDDGEFGCGATISRFVEEGRFPEPLLDSAPSPPPAKPPRPGGGSARATKAGSRPQPGAAAARKGHRHKAARDAASPESPESPDAAGPPRSWPLQKRASRKVLGPGGSELYLLTLRCHPTGRRAIIVAVSASTDVSSSLELGPDAIADLRLDGGAGGASAEATGDAFADLLLRATTLARDDDGAVTITVEKP